MKMLLTLQGLVTFLEVATKYGVKLFTDEFTITKYSTNNYRVKLSNYAD